MNKLYALIAAVAVYLAPECPANIPAASTLPEPVQHSTSYNGLFAHDVDLAQVIGDAQDLRQWSRDYAGKDISSIIFSFDRNGDSTISIEEANALNYLAGLVRFKIWCKSQMFYNRK